MREPTQSHPLCAVSPVLHHKSPRGDTESSPFKKQLVFCEWVFWLCAHHACAWCPQKLEKGSRSLELELYMWLLAILWVLGMKYRVSGRAVSALNC